MILLSLPMKKERTIDAVKIVHSPTNRKYKGTELIISVIDKIKKEKKHRIPTDGKCRSKRIT